jgi:AbrB family looped-hinge helix DNA binding protein
MRATANKEDGTMPLVKLLGTGQVTLPAPMRRRLNLNQGALLEAEEVEGGILLRPVAVVDREGAWKAIREAQANVHYIGPEPRPDPEEEGEQIAAIVREHRDRQV